MKQPITQTPYRRELKDKILQTAFREFTAKGVKAVRMDDIAELLSISKRTLFEIYGTKEALLLEMVKQHEDQLDNHMRTFMAEHPRNVMEILLEFLKLQMKELDNTNINFYEEIHKYKSVIDFLQTKHDRRNDYSRTFFREGIKEGYFRDDIDYDIVRVLGLNAMEKIMRTQLYKKYSLKRIYKNLVFLYLRGFCTIKGITILDEQLLNQFH